MPFDDTVADEVEAAAAQERPGISLIQEALERSEMSECFQGYLQGLPDDYRAAILLHDVHGLTNPEVAALVGCSLPTAKIRVHRAHERLRDTLQGACDFHLDDRGVMVCGKKPPEPDGKPTRHRQFVGPRRVGVLSPRVVEGPGPGCIPPRPDPVLGDAAGTWPVTSRRTRT